MRLKQGSEKQWLKTPSNLVKDIDTQAQAVGLTPNRINLNKSMPRHIIIQLLKTKDKEKSLESSQRNNTLTCGGTSVP